MVLTVIIALIPAAVWGIIQFADAAVLLMAVGIISAVVSETIITRLAGQPLSIRDGHAALVGLMFAMLMPPGVPWWLVAVGASVGILIGKMPFGPLGGSPISPALVGVLIVTLSWPSEMTRFIQPTTADDMLKVPNAAPAEDPQTAVLMDPSEFEEYDKINLFLGDQVGTIGGISPFLLLLGGLFLIWRRVTRWQGPVGFILGLCVTAAITHAISPGIYPDALFQLFTGVAMFGAFFLCTEWSSTPVSGRGLFLFGLSAGALAILLRLTGMEFGRVAWAIVITSLATPLFDRITTIPFGKVVDHA